MRIRTLTSLLILCAAGVFNGCATRPPEQLDNVCAIFKEKSGWYKAARKSEEKWRSPIAVSMAIIHQESRFVARAKPERTKILWIIPGPRPSSAYGYSQAKDETWDGYIRDSGNRGADRYKFHDAIDFVAWYNAQSYARNKIPRNDAYHLYLAYHEGQGGFEQRTYRKKKWLLNVARDVSARAARYDKQLQGCRKDLERHWWWPF